ncbi:ABC transporter ATP-binding protein [Sulfitobacter sp. SK012]|uniref:cyclic nucleotide-binding domain-containing protein n=1 Tax=Sulfitobacter sp. SK012 TaxID=1389005 RepID=UPI000E0BA93E|nr:cyclic nucleotide-binding domain-containing protein [Sulfitobacter sp. SK012]AXI45263.1 ABC transporter ATP-binding protein [Sulfitobacter sp. SK012]
MVLLLVTLTLFPLLYLTLELPKRIINDAIGATDSTVTVLGINLGQITFLIVLCVLFLTAVLVHGLMKMRVNTMKGMMAERLLRRLRHSLIARILRFPPPVMARTSEGELVSMVMSETEPMGGLMGDAIAQPVLQGGQMLTILTFLFAQSATFGFAAIAFIPLQAWLIPKLQRRVNLLNKERVIEVRALAGEIGVNAVAASALRTNGGWHHRTELVSARLARLLAIRFEIFRKKFFMKFVNNFISQLTPFFFYAVGGYLAITGEISIGALVAALAAFKDLSGPWKELLTYYNQSQEMSLRWDMIRDKFTPSGLIKAHLIDGQPTENPTLSGDLELADVSLRTADGSVVLDGAGVIIPQGQTASIVAPTAEDRQALCSLLQRELAPSSGTVTLEGRNLADLHQLTIARRIGRANAQPMIFDGTFRDNVLMPLTASSVPKVTALVAEGMPNTTALVPQDHPLAPPEALRDWWFNLLTVLGIDRPLYERGLILSMPDDPANPLAQMVPGLRSDVAAAIAKADLQDSVGYFTPDIYNTALPVAENLLFALSNTRLSWQVIAEQRGFLAALAAVDAESELLELSKVIVGSLLQVFGKDGDDHPLFQKLELDVETYYHVVRLVEQESPVSSASKTDKAHLIAVLFAISSDKLGSAFEPETIDRILNSRTRYGAQLRKALLGVVTPIEHDTAIPGLSVFENALFGKTHARTRRDEQALRNLVGEVLHKAGCARPVLDLVLDMPVTRAAGLPAFLGEVLSLSRATVKEPSLMLLDNALASFDTEVRESLPAKLRTLLPDATVIFFDLQNPQSEGFDSHWRLQHGRIIPATDAGAGEDGGVVPAELSRKMQVLQQSDLFSGLPRKQLRLLGFGARWYEVQAGEYVFRKNDPSDSGAFLVVSGSADLLMPDDNGKETRVTTVSEGTLVGELGLIRHEPRFLGMRATQDLVCLNIGREEFLAVVENDAATMLKLLQVFAGYIAD